MALTFGELFGICNGGLTEFVLICGTDEYAKGTKCNPVDLESYYNHRVISFQIYRCEMVVRLSDNGKFLQTETMDTKTKKDS